MAIITAPKGTADVLPESTYKWQHIERQLREICNLYGFEETRFPTFEHTELFLRGVGETTDVVQKEMYTFTDKADRSITLRPEGTASVVRQVLEHGLYGGALPLKMYYIIPCFRYEKPQAGRLREFHQFGLEVFGSPDPAADCEVIAFGSRIFRQFGIEDITLEINSIGCAECRSKYKQALVGYYSNYKDTLCGTCLERLDKNPLRLLDCKSPVCGSLKAEAPSILDYLCEECADHFEKVKAGLDRIGLDYTVNPSIVRGLDYYNRTVFEFVSNNIGAQGTALAGGRYDGLAQELGGAPLAGLGFAMGMERLLLLLDSAKIEIPTPPVPDLFIAALGEKAALFAAKAAEELRNAGKSVQTDLNGRSLKAQMKYAAKLSCRYVAIVGDNELECGEITLKDMSNSEQRQIKIEQMKDSI